MNEKLIQGQKVEFKIHDTKFTGEIQGIALEYVPLSGRTYIIKINGKLNSYDYTHIALSEILITKIDF